MENFGVFQCHLVYFMANCYTCCHFGMFSPFWFVVPRQICNPAIDLGSNPLDEDPFSAIHQGCQILLDTIYQNGGKYTKLPLNYHIAIPRMYQMAVIYSKWHTNLSIPKPCKMYPNWDFWFENIPSGNPAVHSRSKQIGFYLRNGDSIAQCRSPLFAFRWCKHRQRLGNKCTLT
jgi:hypothetical protein